MSASDDGAPGHPWLEDPGRMAEDLRYVVNMLRDALPRTPQEFDRVRHGGIVQRALVVVRKALQKPTAKNLSALERLGAATESAAAGLGHASGQDLDELRQVRDERNALYVELAGCRQELEALRKELDARRANAAGDLATATGIEGLKAQLDESRKEVARLTSQNDELATAVAEFAEIGTPDDLRELAQLGEPEGLKQLITSSASTLRTAMTGFHVYDRMAREYEAVLGPLLLAYDRRGVAIETLLHTVAGDSLRSSPPLSQPLSSILSDLAAEQLPFTSAQDALTQLRDRIRSAGAGVVDPALPAADDIAVLAGMTVADRAEIRQRLLRSSYPAPLLDEYRALLETFSAQAAADESVDEDVPASDPPDHDAEDDDEPEIVGTSAPASASSTASASRRRTRGSLSRLRSASAGDWQDQVNILLEIEEADGRKHHRFTIEKSLISSLRSGECARPRPSNQSALEEYQKQILELFKTWDSVRPSHLQPWPEGEPQPVDIPSGMLDAAIMPWRLGLFLSEHVAPVLQQYGARAVACGGVLIGLAAAVVYYATSPWDYIRDSFPQPISFRPEDPRFARLYLNAVNIYVNHAQALPERLHFFLVAPDSSTAGYKIFFADRRLRYEKLSPLWNGFLMLLWEALSQPGVDADLVLDPFFMWMPVFGVMEVAVGPGESLADAVRRVDLAEPERACFLLNHEREHPIHKLGCYEHVKEKFFALPSASAVPTTRPGSVPPAPTVISKASKKRISVAEAAVASSPAETRSSSAASSAAAKRARVNDEALASEAEGKTEESATESAGAPAPNAAKDSTSSDAGGGAGRDTGSSEI